MVIEVPQNLMYSIDRGNYDQRIAVSNMVFILSHHLSDETDDFLNTELFKRLHNELLVSTIQRWCYEITVMKEIIGEVIPNYTFDSIRAELIVEKERHEEK